MFTSNGRGAARLVASVVTGVLFSIVLSHAAMAQVQFDADAAMLAQESREAPAPTRRIEGDDMTKRPTLLSEKARNIEKKTWDGFLTGLRDGFEAFPRPIDVPLYFEDPFINTDLRPFVLYHEFPRGSVLAGGSLFVQAVQARVALTERLAFIATADGYTDLEPGVAAGALSGDGWNDLAVGLKYAFYVNKEKQEVASAGVRWRLSNGSRDVVQGIEDEISVFVTGAKKFDKLYVIADTVGRFTTHGGRGNDVLHWDVSAAYEVLPHFFPTLEYHGLTYLSNGNGIPTTLGTIPSRDGGLDYGNFGANDVRGSSAHWGTVGLHWNFMPDVALRAGYSFGLQENRHNDIIEERVIVGLNFTF